MTARGMAASGEVPAAAKMRKPAGMKSAAADMGHTHTAAESTEPAGTKTTEAGGRTEPAVHSKPRSAETHATADKSPAAESVKSASRQPAPAPTGKIAPAAGVQKAPRIIRITQPERRLPAPAITRLVAPVAVRRQIRVRRSVRRNSIGGYRVLRRDIGCSGRIWRISVRRI